MKNISLLSGFMLSVLLTAFSANLSASTVYVPDFGTSGDQSFSYTFTSDFAGTLLLGVSNANNVLNPSSLSIGPILLSTDSNTSPTSGYNNTLGEVGTTGSVYTLPFLAFQSMTFSFNWKFDTTDTGLSRDFAFVELKDYGNNVRLYSVLAQVGLDSNIPIVPIPGAVWLFGSAIFALLGFSRRKAA